jgi:lanthanide-dependent methanol dehydrogenase
MILHGQPLSVSPPLGVALPLATAALLCVRGLGRVHATRPRVLAFIAGWAILGIALATPLHGLGQRALAWHMAQHVLLMALAAPLLVWSRPAHVLLRGLPVIGRRAGIGLMRRIMPALDLCTGVLIAAALHAVVVWTWHVPRLYTIGVRNAAVHDVQHITMLIAALLFWASVLAAVGMRQRTGAAVLSLFVTTLHLSLLAVLMTFARAPWYEAYRTNPGALEDQQLAGLLMWIPGALPYVGVALALVWLLLSASGAPRRVRQLPLPASTRALLPALALAFLAACGNDTDTGATGDGRAPAVQARSGTPPQDDGMWRMAAKDYASTRFSGLTQIDTANVAQLSVAWTFATGVLGGHEAAPIVVDGTMYLISPFPHRVFALDLTRAGAPMKWQYQPPFQRAARGVACCDVVNRGVVHADGRIHFNTLDNQVIALDAATGREIWRTRVGDINRGETMTMAPIVVKGRVIVGNSGGEFGVRGWIAALDAGTGVVAWRAYSTGPDEDMLIGGRFRPFYEPDRRRDLGVSTWPPDAWRQGGGTVWGWVSYDPELDLVIYGTGNPGPWNPEMRPGDNKWTASVIARDPDDGQAVWAYQWSPHDLYDHDGVNENVLVDLDWNGARRRVLLHPERNGYVYVLDRTTGEVLAADPFVHITSSRGVDLSTGRLIPVREKEPKLGRVVREICPSAPGAKDWQPSAYSFATGLLYMPHNNLCMDFEAIEASYIAGTPYVGANVRYYAGPGGQQGVFTAWDPVARRAAWRIEEPFPVWSGALATAGNIVFYGTMDGWFKAVHAQTGEPLWQFKASSGIIGQPITYRGPDGRQYVAVFSGVGGWPGAVVVNDLDTRDPTAGNGWGDAMRPLKDATRPGSTLYVFALP